MTRSRWAVIVLTLLGAGLILLSVSRTWAIVRLGAPLGDALVSGRRQLPAGAPVALAAGAAAVVLGIAGRALRVVVAAGLAIAGAVLAVAAARAGQDDAGASSIAARRSLGLVTTKGLGGQAFGIDAAFTFWPWVAVAGAGLIAVAGLTALVCGWSWPVSGRRFERPGPGLGPQDGGVLGRPGDPTAPAGRPAVMAENAGPRSTWDALSRGEDPTSPGEDPT